MCVFLVCLFVWLPFPFIIAILDFHVLHTFIIAPVRIPQHCVLLLVMYASVSASARVLPNLLLTTYLVTNLP